MYETIDVAPISVAFAGLPAAAPIGQEIWLSNIGNAIMGASPVAATGSKWFFDGSIWRPAGGRVRLATLDTAIVGLTNSEVVSAQLLLPAAFFRVGDRLRVEFTMTKSGTTDTGLIRKRIGTAGTTADAIMGLGTALSAAQQSGRFFGDFRIESATAIQVLCSSNAIDGGTASALPAATTIANISNALYVDFGAVSNSTNNTVGLSDIVLTLFR